MFAKIRAVLDELLIVLKLLRVLLRWLAFGLTVRPRGLGDCVQLSEEYSAMGQVFVFRQGLLPIPEAKIKNQGIVSQRLIVTVDGVAQEPIISEAEATSVIFKAGPAGATVTRSIDYLDNAGNDSDNFDAPAFVIIDGIAPEAPAGFGEVVQIGEEFVADEVPADDPVDVPDEVPVDVPEDVPADDPPAEPASEDLPL